jgi:hypothetical protein
MKAFWPLSDDAATGYVMTIPAAAVTADNALVMVTVS